MHEGESKKNSQQCVCVKPFVADISIVIDWRVPKYCRKKKQKQNKPCLLSLVCRAQESRIIELRNRSINKLTSVACTETEDVVFFGFCIFHYSDGELIDIIINLEFNRIEIYFSRMRWIGGTLEFMKRSQQKLQSTFRKTTAMKTNVRINTLNRRLIISIIPRKIYMHRHPC